MTGQQKGAVFAGAAGLLAWWWWNRSSSTPAAGRPLIPSVTTSENFDLAAAGPASYSSQIQRFGQAIARAEGFYTIGSIPNRANNPGDLKLANKLPLPGTRITLFPNADAGWSALYRQLYLILSGRSGIYTVDMTIDQMAARWADDDEGTALTAGSRAWSSNVARYLGVPTSTPLWAVLA